MILDIIGPGHAFGEMSLLDASGKTTYKRERERARVIERRERERKS
jgi:hypothetical protein